MTIRGGGDPRQAWLLRRPRDGPAAPELRHRCASLHHGRAPHGPAEYKGVARVRVRHGELPSDREIRLDRTAPYKPAPAKAGVWLADITDIPTGAGWLYLAVILDRFTRNRRLGEARAYARRTHHGRTDHGRPTAPSEGGLDPSRGSRQSVRCQRLSLDPAGRRHHPIDEPQAKLPGQCTNRECLRHPEKRTRPSARIPRPRCRAAQPVRVHRSLLQSSADPLRYRLHHPRAGRPENRITPCPLSRGKVSTAAGMQRHRAGCHRVPFDPSDHEEPAVINGAVNRLFDSRVRR